MEVVEIPMASRDLVRFPNLPDDHLLNRMQMRIVDAGEAEAAVELDLAPQVSNGAGSLQGGLLATLVDVVAGRAVAATLDGPATFVTRDLSVHYLGVLGSSPVRADAHVRRRYGADRGRSGRRAGRLRLARCGRHAVVRRAPPRPGRPEESR